MFALKLALSALIIAGASELGKRSTMAGALLVSLPLSSLLVLTWLHIETKDPAKVSAMATGILWAIIPSSVFFVALPLLLRRGMSYWPALGLTCAATAAGYGVYAAVLRRFGVAL